LQWYFDNDTVYTRECTIMGLITPAEDADRARLGYPPVFGPRVCSKGDCLRVTVGGPGATCGRCDEVPDA
jgi:hypothetical protein